MSSDPDWLSDADEEELIRQRVYEERVAKHTAGQEQSRAWAAERMESADELAMRLLLLAALEGAVAQSIKRTKEILGARMTVGDLKRPEINGMPAGAVTYAHGSRSVTVTDPAALAEWVLDNYPTEVELVTTVRQSFLDQIIEATKRAGEPAGPGGELGLPGVSVRDGMPRLSARPDRARMPELWLEARANPLRLITSMEQP